MDTRTGKIIDEKDIPKGEEKFFVPVVRDVRKSNSAIIEKAKYSD